jgi:hypothetical protein
MHHSSNLRGRLQRAEGVVAVLAKSRMIPECWGFIGNDRLALLDFPSEKGILLMLKNVSKIGKNTSEPSQTRRSTKLSYTPKIKLGDAGIGRLHPAGTTGSSRPGASKPAARVDLRATVGKTRAFSGR